MQISDPDERPRERISEYRKGVRAIGDWICIDESAQVEGKVIDVEEVGRK